MVAIQREVRKRGLFGKLFKWAFIAFNLLMLIWIISYWANLSHMQSSSDAERVGTAIGGTLGTGMLFGFWVCGDVILGMIVLFTRGQRILITEEQS